MNIFPAIDLKDGQVVRLTEGRFDDVTVYGDDPLAVAAGFRAAGAAHLHVVDLDGAKDGVPRNADILRALVSQSGLSVQTGGGIRTGERVEALLSLGVARVILGTAALRDADFRRDMVRVHGDKIAIGVDVRDGRVAVAGWLDVSDVDGMDFCQTLRDEGVQTVIYTDISRDGRLQGTNLAAYARLSAIDGLRVIASGGISAEAEITALRDMGIWGAIVGKALYAGRVDLGRAIALAGEGTA